MIEKISTGSKEFDRFLNGGYEKDIITTLYGPAGSGKSNFCIMAAVEQARNGKKVIYIDTEGGFSIERVKQVTEMDVLNNIVLLKPTSFKEQKEAFKKLLEEIRHDKISLIVIDSMVMLYRLELGLARENAKIENDEEKIGKLEENERKKIQEVNREMASQLRILAEIARKKLIPILVTNQVYASFDEPDKVRMVGGDLLKYWSKSIIELQDEGIGRKRAILRKHRSLAEEREFNFAVVNEGIKERKFFKLF
ncbi:DNA repair and recombination protein RadB [Candidatus Pacearchaeota archaeon CG_4_9_14_3_um_filter_31_7]|nr:MAG: DNA repair and recombination protein RadB [Candidatus Pacearchaeota archaeon CG1_02_31_27]PIN92602.1 MAG: DNA repair and recombination protein RadB [Candidatus Pacearchaeota archaeon CG10_big_fil_rev_8_21_14_0_10_31_59]PIZ81215.1 MAG: DNA repair and recombination protein RadB [Candidatus Pacearchaeota archaeon CG_4_10_14_0_2_um_filter_31_10]PJA70454.1 MAG: DNA repair and recombination protein RadB [Candidatus Pacearchaeota archaeon CG_4_9_14_3_um_filter_31_7]